MYKKIKFLSFLLLSIFSCASAQEEVVTEGYTIDPGFNKRISSLINFSIPVISVEEVSKNQSQYQLLDAREPEEYQVSHIKGARLVGYKNFDPTSVKDIQIDDPIVIYCSIGYRSEKVGDQLKALGFTNIYNLYGSIFEWVNQGHPVVTTENNLTKEVHTYNRLWSKWVDERKADKVW